jgi:hypothetical protein
LKLILTILVQQDIVWLDISMQNHLAMHDVNSSEHLLHHELDSIQGNLLLLLHEEFSQGRIAILKDAVNDLVSMALILDDIKNLHKIGLIA